MLGFGFKKLVIGSVAAASLGAFVFGRDMCSYVRTGANQVRHSIKREVPVEFEIERARELVSQLTPEIHQSLHVIAEEEVELERLAKSIDQRGSDLGHQQEAILSLSSDLKSGESRFVYAGRKYTPGEVQKDLASRFNRFKVADETLKREQEILSAKNSAVASHRQKLEGMLSAKKDLEVEIERLEARLQSVRAAETMSDLRIDDSALNRAKSLIADLNKELDVRERVLDAEGKFTGVIPVELKDDSPSDIADQVRQYFDAEGRAENQVVTSAQAD